MTFAIQNSADQPCQVCAWTLRHSLHRLDRVDTYSVPEKWVQAPQQLFRFIHGSCKYMTIWIQLWSKHMLNLWNTILFIQFRAPSFLERKQQICYSNTGLIQTSLTLILVWHCPKEIRYTVFHVKASTQKQRHKTNTNALHHFWSHPQCNPLSMHINMHYTISNTNPIASQPSCAQN